MNVLYCIGIPNNRSVMFFSTSILIIQNPMNNGLLARKPQMVTWPMDSCRAHKETAIIPPRWSHSWDRFGPWQRDRAQYHRAFPKCSFLLHHPITMDAIKCCKLIPS